MPVPPVGHWLVRLRRGAPLVPMRIAFVDHEPGLSWNKLDRYQPGHARPGIYIAEIAGQDADVFDAIMRVRTIDSPGGRPISQAEYEWRLADLRWCEQFAPEEAKAQPRQRVDFRTATLPF